MSEYSVEKVRAHARMLRECRINTEATRDRQQDKLADICDAYADLLERIKADEGAVPVVCIPFGHGNVVVTTGKHGDVPCVYLAPASMPGVVGESAARENLPRDKRVPGESILTFPTAEQAAIVAAALCGKSVHRPAQSAQADEVAAKSPGFGIACTVTWTELFDAMTADGMNPPNKCGPATRKWVEQVVRDYLTRPPAQAAQVDAEGKAQWDELAAILGCDGDNVDLVLRTAKRLMSDRIAPTAEPVAQWEADELIAAYDDAVRSERESGFLPPLAQKAARDCVSHNRSRLRKALAAQPRAVPAVWLDAAGVPYGRVSDEQVLAVLHNAVRIVERRSGLGAVEQALAVPDGMVLVPVEPTDAMCDAGDLPDTATAYDIYKAMLAAAPSPGESA